MKCFCLNIFKEEYEKLSRKNSYKNIGKEMYENFFNKKFSEIEGQGIKLNTGSKYPFIKRRIRGRGGYRFYYLMLVMDEKIYFAFLHPKTGSEGSENLKKEFIKKYLKEVLEAIKTDKLIEVIPDHDKKTILFKEKVLVNK